MIQSITEWVHEWKIKERRVNTLSNTLSKLLDTNSTILDVGCGDGTLAKRIFEYSNAAQVTGIDVLIRKDCVIPNTKFDGIKIPFDNNSFDYILLVDVLHHTENPELLFEECIRVAKKGVLIKDHINNSTLDYYTLRFMDRVGNARYDVNLPHNYLSSSQWNELFKKHNLVISNVINRLHLYPVPFNLLFDRQLHSIWHLTKLS